MKTRKGPPEPRTWRWAGALIAVGIVVATVLVLVAIVRDAGGAS